MYSYTMIRWIFFFYFYCFFGWCFESTVVSISQRKPVNRGFMKGPFLPLYGTGAIMMLLVSRPFQDNLLKVYIAGCIGATVLEYVTGVVMEALFKVRYWDYSHKKLHFRGYICVSSTLAWGLLTILMTEVVHKFVERFVFAIPGGILTIVTLLLTAFICGDFALSFKEALDLRDVLIRIEKAKREMQLMQKRLDVILAVADEELTMRKDELVNRKDELVNKKDELTGKITESFEDMMAGIEEKAESIRCLIRTKPAGYWKGLMGERDPMEESHPMEEKNLMEELGDMLKKYHKNAIDPERYGRLKEFYQKRILRSHPTMSSSKFKEALEELKRKAERKDKE